MSGTESPITGQSTDADPLNVPTVEATKEPTGAEANAQASAEANAQAGAEANAQAGAEAKAKTCVEPMNAKPSEDGDYVMFDGTKYTVFTIKDGAGLPKNLEADAQFFKVVEKPMAGGRRKKQHKSAKKQRKSAKKQHKSSKKQRKSRGSRRSKK